MPTDVEVGKSAGSTQEWTSRHDQHSHESPEDCYRRGSERSEPSGKIWSLYLHEAEKYDKELFESWKGDTEGILVFTGLFSATVATFLAESYKTLQPDTGGAAVLILTQISHQLAAMSNGTHLPLAPLTSVQPTAYKPTASALRVNAFWFLSLSLSLACALIATLMQQCARRYMRLVSRRTRSAPAERARVRAFFAEGMETFGMAHAVEALPALLHIAVFLFFAGLADFLFAINDTMGRILDIFVALSAFTYVFLTGLPIACHHSPYRTPLSTLVWHVLQRLVLAYHWGVLVADIVLCRLRDGRYARALITEKWSYPEWHSAGFSASRSRVAGGMRRCMERTARDLPFQIDSRALEWTFLSIDDDRVLEQFIEAIPDLVRSKRHCDARASLVDLMLRRRRLTDCFTRLLAPSSTHSAVVRNRRLHALLCAIWCLADALDSQKLVNVYESPKNTLFVLVNVASSVPDVSYSPEYSPTVFSELHGRCRLIKECTTAMLDRLRAWTWYHDQAGADADYPKQFGLAAEGLHRERDGRGRSLQLAGLTRFARSLLQHVQRNAPVYGDECYYMVYLTCDAILHDFRTPTGGV